MIRKLFSLFGFSLLSVLGSEEELSWTPFAPASDGVGLYRMPPAESGLQVSSTYNDPRAWGERLQAGTIGTVGTGIGVGDFDGDGYPDLFVGIREGKNRVYINSRDGGFFDHTEESEILESSDWTTGVTVMDVNADQLPDIYVCFFNSPNRLYLNVGDAVFKEVANEYGLAIRDASSGAFFADYDKDGDLDLYLQTNIQYEAGGQSDYFFRNDGGDAFLDVTSEVGIHSRKARATLGHSVLWVDYDGDGWEDIYVANDFRAPDFMYLNNGDGTFRVDSSLIPEAPYSSMGSDVGDVDGDGRLDILTTDMATPSYQKHVESMLTSGVKTRELPANSRPRQTMKNALLLNRGSGDYVDVAYSWNLAATDWTWAPRLIDLDNDGWLDAFFTNGMIRQFHNADLALAQDRQRTSAAKTAVFRRSPVLDEENLVFRNASGRGFQIANELWRFDHKGVSFGAAVLDVDRDGDLDIVYTNYEAPPTLWRNDIGSVDSVQVRLIGSKGNTEAIGASVVARFGDRVLAKKILSNRGYLGSDEKLLHFGLGDCQSIESLAITWPDGEKQEVNDLRAGRRYLITQSYQDSFGPEPHAVAPIVRFVWQESVDSPRSGGGSIKRPIENGLLYPFKPTPGPVRSKMLRSDLNSDGKDDILILRDWASPRLILSGDSGMRDVSEISGFDELSGLWEVALAEDFNGDGKVDVFLGGMGINNDVSYRSAGEGFLRRFLGRFQKSGVRVNLNDYQWGSEFRLYDGLRDFSEIDGGVFAKINSFRETADLNAESFIDQLEFQVEERFEIDRFRSGMMLNEGNGAFGFEPLPLEGQYGRVWDAVATDLNEDGLQDLVLLLGQVSPHSRSSQDETSHVSVLLGQGQGRFLADKKTPFDVRPSGRVIGFEFDGRLSLLLEEGRKLIYRIAR